MKKLYTFLFALIFTATAAHAGNIELKVDIVSTDAYIAWSNPDETENFAYYLIERSKDGINFEKINTVKKTATGGFAMYRFIDKNAFALEGTKIYYRVTAVFQSGASTESRIVELRNTRPAEPGKSFTVLYPNPVMNTAQVNLVHSEKDIVEASIFNASGMLVRRYVWQITPGRNTFDITGAQLKNGNYVLKIDGRSISKSIKFQKI